MRQTLKLYPLALAAALGVALTSLPEVANAQDKTAAKCLKIIDKEIKKQIVSSRKGGSIDLAADTISSNPKCANFDPTTIGYTGCPEIPGTACDAGSSSTTLQSYLDCVICALDHSDAIFGGPSPCGNGVVDTDLGETCDPPGSVGGCPACQICLNDCTCQTPSGTCPANPSGGPNVAGFKVKGGADLDSGWTGVGHNQGVILDALSFTCLSDCDATTDPECVATGPTGDGTINGKTFGPPLPLVAENVATCVENRFQEDISATVNLQTGETSLNVSLTSIVFLTGNKKRPCPTCSGSLVGDTGKCSAGPNVGKSCTVEGRTEKFGNTSSDCPAFGGDKAGELAITLPVSTESVTLPATDSCPGGTCPCPGTIAFPVSMNNCDNPSSCGTALCPSDDVASGAQTGFDQKCCRQGSKIISCFNGDITREGTRAIVVDENGMAWPDGVYPKTATTGKLASAFCIPATNEVTINQPIGLPGPGAFILPGDTCVDTYTGP